MNPEIVTYLSRDGKTTIYAEKYVPSKEIKGILIVVHGMDEYFGQYKEMSELLASEGYLVAGPDHLGHGHTARDHQKEFGYFADNDGATVVVRDVHRLKKMIQEEYPDKPIFILGHSLGSFIVRDYIEMYGTGIQGAVLMGSAKFNSLIVRAGMLLLSIQSLFLGWHGRSSIYTKLAMGAFRKAYPDDGPSGWLCAREEGRNYSDKDDLLGKEFTLNGYYCMSEMILRMQDESRIKDIPKELPLLFMSGEGDPIGNYGRDIKKIAEDYRASGLKNVKVKLYPGDRHELYHEADRYNVFFDIIKFMKSASEQWKR